MNNKIAIHKLRTVVGYALIGSVLTGALLGWVPSSFDLRIVGAAIGMLLGTASLLRA